MSEHDPQKRILIVDDDPDFLEYIRIVLRSAGYQVCTATSASDALAFSHSTTPDLIIIDVMMSYSLEGIGLAQDLKHDPELAGVPLLVVTSIARSIEAVGFDEETLNAIEGFFVKPVSPSELLTVIASHFSKGGEHGSDVAHS
jgi:CheY-like chemotaxis protein